VRTVRNLLNTHDEGLTLIELLITVAVIAIVFAIAVPVVLNITAGVRSDAASVTSAARADFSNQYFGALGASSTTDATYTYAVFKNRTIAKILTAPTLTIVNGIDNPVGCFAVFAYFTLNNAAVPASAITLQYDTTPAFTAPVTATGTLSAAVTSMTAGTQYTFSSNVTGPQSIQYIRANVTTAAGTSAWSNVYGPITTTCP
jgi:prepilin-type N-terminal cleavage/methylation domain-containing protein